MDLLKDAAKNISLYDVKAYVRKAQNGMLHVFSREREALSSLVVV